MTACTTKARQDIVFPENKEDYRHINTLAVPNAESPIHGIYHFYINSAGMETIRTGGSYPTDTKILGKAHKPVKTEEGRYKEGDLAAARQGAS